MRIEEEFTIGVSIERMYQEMNNIAEIGYCIEGVKKVEVVSDTESRWTIEARAGFMARTFNVSGRITERRAPTYLAFEGTGQDLKLGGHFELTAIGARETQCHAVINADVVGSFATIVELMAKGPQKQLIAKTVSNVRQKLEAIAAAENSTAEKSVVVSPATAQPAPEPSSESFLARARSALSRLPGREPGKQDKP